MTTTHFRRSAAALAAAAALAGCMTMAPQYERPAAPVRADWRVENMPATGTPEPGGLSWYEALALLRRVIESRNVVGCDVVELAPIPGIVAPNFLCSTLIYKILSYKFADQIRK